MKTKALLLALTLAAPVATKATILINEIVMRTPLTSNADVTAGISDDENFEFVELRSTTSQEYCTLDGTATGAPLTLLLIKTDGNTKYGEVDEAWTLTNSSGDPPTITPMRTGTNSLLLLGDKYDTAGEGPYEFSKNPATTTGDPKGMNAENIQDDEGLTAILVAGWVEPLPNSGADVDFDLNNNSIFDWLEAAPPAGAVAAPYTHVVDSIGFNGSEASVARKTYAAVSVSNTITVRGVLTGSGGASGTLFTPYTIARNAGNTTAYATGVGGGSPVSLTNSAPANPPGGPTTSWYGAIIAGTTGDSSAYDATLRFNKGVTTTWGQVTPGRPNLSAAPPTLTFRIGEINLNPPGSPGVEVETPVGGNPFLNPNDGNYEYVEIVASVAAASATADKSGSLAGLTLVLLNSTGQIREAWDLSKFATGPSGVLMLGDRYPEGYCPFNVDAQTVLADPSAPNYGVGETPIFSSMAAGDIGPNSGFTMALVRNFDKARDVDLDTDDNGILDSFASNTTTSLSDALTPGTANLLDSISAPEIDLNGVLVANRGGYSVVNLAITVAGKRINPDNYSRKVDLSGANPYYNSASSGNTTTFWYAGALGSRNPSSLLYRLGTQASGVTSPFRFAATPGRINPTVAPTAPVVGSLLVNELHINPGGNDDNLEYLELLSTNTFQTMADTWAIFVSSSGATKGQVVGILDLRNQNTGSNRLALFADGIEEASNNLNALVSARTLLDDPQSFGSTGVEELPAVYPGFTQGMLPNTGVAVLLVTNVGAATSGTTLNADLDPENDGIINKAWTTTLDGVSTGDALTIANEASKVIPVIGPGSQPDNVSRVPGALTPVSAAAWFGGQLIPGASPTTLTYGDTFFGPFKGVASPGRLNPVAAEAPAATLLLNEIHINPPTGDNDREYIELLSSTNVAMSTNGWSLLFVDNSGGDTGTVQRVYDLDGYATGTNGMIIAGSKYDTASFPWTATAAAATTRITPEGLREDDIGRFTDNGAVCFLLVKNFTGRVGDDLDIGTDANPSLVDDHILNQPYRWAELTDSASIRAYVAAIPDDPGTLTKNEAEPERIDGFTFPGTADLTQANLASVPKVTWTPDSVARYRNNILQNDKAAWYGGDIAGITGGSTAYDALEKFPQFLSNGAATPGAINLLAVTDSSDFDNDGVPFLIEQALGMNSEVSDTPLLPKSLFGTPPGGGTAQPYFAVTRPVGGVAGITYASEASVDLQDWGSLVMQAPVIVNNGNGTETLNYKINSFILPTVLQGGKVFFRFKATRN